MLFCGNRDKHLDCSQGLGSVVKWLFLLQDLSLCLSDVRVPCEAWFLSCWAGFMADLRDLGYHDDMSAPTAPLMLFCVGHCCGS